jgi:carbamoyl-phosphate synthase large subunit
MAPWFIEQLKEPAAAERQPAKDGPVTRPLPAAGSQARHYYTTHGEEGVPLPADKNKILILGTDSHRIGQGAECDYALFNAARAADAAGFTPVIVSSNPNSIATGLAAPGYCIFERLTPDNIITLCKQEKPVGVIGQFAGRQRRRLITALSRNGVPLLGTPADTLSLVDQRAVFWHRIHALGIPQPAAEWSQGPDDVHSKAKDLGYPLLMHPASKENRSIPIVIRDIAQLDEWLTTARKDCYPLFLEHFLGYAIEAQAEALCDGDAARVVSVFEQIELAGVNPNDSACVSPPYSLSPRHLETINDYTQKIAVALKVKGLFHANFAIYRDTVYLLEAGCTMLRNLSLMSKLTRLPITQSAMRLILGASLDDMDVHPPAKPRVGVRVAVFPFNVFNQVDPMLGIQMRSTGQVLAIDDTFGMAYFKAMQAAANPLPIEGTVLITVTDEDKPSILEPARIFQELGFRLMATRGTHDALAKQGIQSDPVRKLGFGRPHLVDEIKNGNVQMVINTPSGSQSQIDDSFIRKAAIRYHITNITTPASAMAAAKGIAARRDMEIGVTALK